MTIAIRVSTFPPDVIDAAAREREVTLTTYGRRTGNPSDVTIWIVTDGGRVFIRSGQGMVRHWPQNLVARGEGVLHLGKREVKVKLLPVPDPAEARATSALYTKKYGPSVKASQPNEPLTLGELASFELIPAES
jgi:hypothetical protein